MTNIWLNKKQYLALTIVLFLLIFIWIRGGLDVVYLDTDLGRDLSEMSKLWIGTKVIWLGPRLSPGFHASPIYYYIFYPALIISHGNANSLIIFNLILATLSLGLFGYLGIKRFGTSFLLVIGMIGLFPWWSSIVLHPGNGYTYVIWLLLSLSCLWFELPLFFSALFLGLATSFHPAAIFAITLLFYEWFRRKALVG